MTNRLFLLAHPDDEMLCVPFILDRSFGDNGTDYFLYLTINSLSSLRQAETQQAIAYLNQELGDSRIVTIEPILRDGMVWEDLKRDQIHLIFAKIQSLKIDLIVTFAYEGGHQDHDIANALALNFQRTLGVGLTEFSGYRKHSLLPTFLLGKPIFKGDKIIFSRLKALRLFLGLANIHKSQTRVWLIFSPSILIRLLMRSSFKVAAPSDSAVLQKSIFLYQIRGKAPRVRVEAAVNEIARSIVEAKDD